MLLIVIPDQYPNYYKALEIYTGYFDSLDIMILFSYPSGIVVTRDYCALLWAKIHRENIMTRTARTQMFTDRSSKLRADCNGKVI